MKFLVAVCLLGFVAARPQAEVAVEASDDQAFNKNLIDTLKATLKDQSKTKEEKQAAFKETVDGLKGGYKEKFEALEQDVKDKLATIDNENVKAAAEKFVELYESGAIFDSKDVVKAEAQNILKDLSDEEKQELKALGKEYGQKFREEFKDLHVHTDDHDSHSHESHESHEDDDEEDSNSNSGSVEVSKFQLQQPTLHLMGPTRDFHPTLLDDSAVKAKLSDAHLKALNSIQTLQIPHD